MRWLGSLLLVCCLSEVLQAAARTDDPVLATKLAEINVRIDSSLLQGYALLPSPAKVLPNALAGFQNKVTGAIVVISGADVTDTGEPDFHNDERTKLQMQKRRDLLLQKAQNTTIDEAVLRDVNDYTYVTLSYSTRTRPDATGANIGHGILYTSVRDGWNLSLLAIAKYGTDAKDAVADVANALRPLRPSGSPHPGNFEDYQGKIHGFATHLREAGWQKWVRGSEFFPGAFLTGRRAETSFLAIFLLPLPDRGLAIEDHFAATMRTCTRFSNPEQTFKITKDKMPGFDDAIRFAGDVEGTAGSSYFGGWFGQGAGRMMLVLTWADSAKAKDSKAEVAATLRGIEPLPVTGLPPLSTFTPAQRQTQCNVLGEIAAQLLRRGRNEDAAQLYDAALNCSHAEINTLESAVIGMQQIGDYKEAELILGRYWKEFKDSPRVWLLRARLRREAGQKDKATEDYAAAFKAGLRDEPAVLQYLLLLWETDHLDKALEFIEDYDKRFPSPRTARWHAASLGRKKEYEAALAIYSKLVVPRPLDVEAAMQYGEYANQAGKHDIALQMVDVLFKEHQDSPRTRLLEGWAHYGRKEWREAKLSFETARKSAPNDPTVLDALNTANSALGEGDSSAVKQPIEALQLPAEVARRVEKAVAEFKGGDEESGVSLVHTTQISFHKGKPTTTTVRRKIKVLDTSGVDALSTLDIPFDPLAERVFVNQVDVQDEDGKVVTHGKVDDQYVTDPSMDGPATLGRVLRVPVPGLKPGRTLDYVFTKQTLDADKVMRFQSAWIGSSYPAASEAIIIEGDLKDVRAVMNETLKAGVDVIEDPAKGTRSWFVTPAPQLHPEPVMPRFSSFTPVLWLGNPEADWTKVGKDYLELIADQLKPEPAIEALAKKLTEGAASDEQKVSLLSRHVREEITYKAIEFGRRARIPNRPDRVTANHYGDCKDMALLLHHLLQAVGIESYLTLINSHADLAAELPDLDQFNHMILHVPSLKAQFVDCTEGKSAGVNLPPNLFDLQGFVLDPAKPRLVTMPKRADWPASKLVVDRVVHFDSEGSADVADTLEFSSYLAQNMRLFLNSMPAQKRIDSMQGWLQRASHWQLEKVEALNLQDPASPLTLKLRYSVPPPAIGGSLSVKVPAVLEGEYLDLNYLRHRHHPYQLINPIEITTNVHVIGTTPVEPASLQSLNRSSGPDGNAKFCTWSMNAAAVPGAANECLLRFNAFWPASSGEAGEYGPMRKAAASAADAWEVPLHFTDSRSAAPR